LPVARHARAVDESLDALAHRRRQKSGSILVDMLGDDRRREDAQAFGGDGATVVNEIDFVEQRLHRLDVAAVGLLELYSFRKVLEIAADHVVAAYDFVTAVRVGVGEVASQEAGHAGDENFHFCWLKGPGSSQNGGYRPE